jgi:hypothetical protein
MVSTEYGDPNKFDRDLQTVYGGRQTVGHMVSGDSEMQVLTGSIGREDTGSD